MNRRERTDLLPGVSQKERPAPAASYDGRASIARARRNANIRDVVDTILLLAVDLFFVMWPAARIPMLTRQQSLMLLLVVHAIYGVHILATRILPAIRAHRVASTWEATERSKFKTK